jgi:hypothetical protein
MEISMDPTSQDLRSHLVAAVFDEQAEADSAAHALRNVGLTDGNVAQLVVSAPGRHAEYPIGGDVAKDPGARQGAGGALTGAAIGGAAGAVAGVAAAGALGPLAAVATTAIGAYAGSLAGALDRMHDTRHSGAPPARPAGVMVIARVDSDAQRDAVVEAFRNHRARSIEQAEGRWGHGTWADFDPVAAPHWLQPPIPREETTPAPS